MALDMKAFNAIVGKPKVPKTHRDNDGDGLMNMLDCKPNNPKKKGVIHRIGAAVVEKLGATDRAEEIRERGQIIDEARKEARIEGTRKRAEQIKETANYREEERGKAQRERIRSGGTLGMIGRGVSTAGKGIGQFSANVNKGMNTQPVTQQKRKRKGKKGKGKKARVIKKIQQEVKPKSFDFRDVGRAF